MISLVWRLRPLSYLTILIQPQNNLGENMQTCYFSKFLTFSSFQLHAMSKLWALQFQRLLDELGITNTVGYDHEAAPFLSTSFRDNLGLTSYALVVLRP